MVFLNTREMSSNGNIANVHHTVGHLYQRNDKIKFRPMPHFHITCTQYLMSKLNFSVKKFDIGYICHEIKKPNWCTFTVFSNTNTCCLGHISKYIWSYFNEKKIIIKIAKIYIHFCVSLFIISIALREKKYTDNATIHGGIGACDAFHCNLNEKNN